MVESIGVGEEIKTRSGDWRGRIANYKPSLRTAARGEGEMKLPGRDAVTAPLVGALKAVAGVAQVERV